MRCRPAPPVANPREFLVDGLFAVEFKPAVRADRDPEVAFFATVIHHEGTRLVGFCRKTEVDHQGSRTKRPCSAQTVVRAAVATVVQNVVPRLPVLPCGPCELPAR